MKFTAILALCVSLASAGVVITPIFDNQVVAKEGGDCALGVVTPSGCGPLRGGAARNTVVLTPPAA